MKTIKLLTTFLLFFFYFRISAGARLGKYGAF